jgi:hypothetical protein
MTRPWSTNFVREAGERQLILTLTLRYGVTRCVISATQSLSDAKDPPTTSSSERILTPKTSCTQRATSKPLDDATPLYTTHSSRPT